MNKYFKESVHVIVEDTKCEFFIPLEFALNLKQGDVLFPIESGKIANWVLKSENIERIEDACVTIKERFFCGDSIMIF